MKKTYAFKSLEGREAVIKAYEGLLNNIDFDYEKLYIKTRFGKAFILAAGEITKPVLILLHGSAMNSIMWAQDMKEYAKNHRVYAIDIQGEPGKSNGEQLSLHNSDFEDWLSDIFIGLSIEKASIVGISLGGWIALKFAITNKEKVDRLVLLCPAGIGAQKVSFAFKSLFYMLLGEKGLDKIYKKVNGDKNVPKAILDYQKLIGRNFNYRKETIPLFSDDDLKKLTMKSILFVGKKDIMIKSLKTIERYEKFVPNGKINLLPDSGHTLINLTNEIIEFLRD